MKYTKTFRDSILRKVLPPENRSISSVSKEMGVAVVTIIMSYFVNTKKSTGLRCKIIQPVCIPVYCTGRIHTFHQVRYSPMTDET